MDYISTIRLITTDVHLVLTQENVTTDALNSWILDVHVGASPAGDHVAFGFDDKLAILQSRYNNQPQQQQQHMVS